MYQEILYDVQDPVATITLNRPKKMNAMTNRTLREIKHAIAEAERDDRVVGIVLTGAGRGFCAGIDMGDLSKIQQAGSVDSMRVADDVPDAQPGDPSMGPGFGFWFTYLMAVRKPIVAAVNGACAGMGFSMAMMCDLRFISESAFFMAAFAQRGLVSEHGSSWVLPRLLGPSRALDLVWSGRRIDAQEALALGLANRVVEPENVVAAAQAYIQQLAATASPQSLMDMKQQIYGDLQRSLTDSVQDTTRRQEASYVRPDFKEGIASFVEKRPPQFDRISGD